MSDTQLAEYRKVATEEGVLLGLNTLHTFGTVTSFRVTKDGAHTFIPVDECKDPEYLRAYIKYMFHT